MKGSSTRGISSWFISDESRERFYRLTDIARRAVHYGWIPFILLIGYIRSEPRPALIRLLNPLS